VALRIDAEFANDWRAGKPGLVEIVADTTRRDSEIPSARVRAALEGYGAQVGALRLLARGIDPSIVRAVSVGSRDLATEEAKRGLMLAAIMPYLLILMSFIGGAYLIMDATAGERERQSLEPLLATPASRGAIVSGKIAAACAMGLLSLLLTLVAFKLSAQMSTGVGRMLDVSFASIGRMLLILLPMVFIGTTLLTCLAAAAKSLKEAQSHMTWLMLLPMIPTIALIVNPVKTQAQMLLKVIRGEAIDLRTWGIYLGTGFAVAALLWLVAVRRYHQERLAISG
jgi:sodium transport system permease protein